MRARWPKCCGRRRGGPEPWAWPLREQADLRVFAPGPRRAGAVAGEPRRPRPARFRPTLRRRDRPRCREVSELDVVRHYTRLSQLNFSIDTHFYPLGSCTMKYNPKACNAAALLPEFLAAPSARSAAEHGQGFLACLYELQEMLKAVTGMRGVALEPAGRSARRVRRRGDDPRLSPRARRAWSATRSSCRRPRMAPIRPRRACAAAWRAKLRSGPTATSIWTALRAAVGPQTAGIMLTNPSTLGVFERRIEEVARIVHEAGGLLYYDGANLNAILGKVRPGDMGIRRHTHESAQDLLDAARRRRPGRRRGRRVGAAAAVPAAADRARENDGDARLTAGSPSATCRSRSAG